ncbi:MAG TPA: hypothetical protein VFO39_16955 [Candidatus Sulfotelmatobacter sp.]|nr:hypothetical protein [Candidatus Sulfotelmatobacter sp.]
MFAMRRANPYVLLLIGTAWVLVSWGLFQLHDWARFTATILLGVGVAWELSLLASGKVQSGPQLVAYLLEIVVRLAAIVYLMRFEVVARFRLNRPLS